MPSEKERDIDMKEDEDCEIYSHNLGLGCALENFQDADEVMSIIKDIPEHYKESVKLENALERFTVILDYYQEQPHLVDPYLDQMLEILLGHLKGMSADNQCIHVTFKYMYLIIKVRGLKTVVRHLPHQVVDLEPVLQFLEKQNVGNYKTWETRYVLMLWLAILSMIPFTMTNFDDGKTKPITQRILDVTKKHIGSVDKSRDAAAFVVSKFLTRPDIVNKYLPEYLEWTLKNLNEPNTPLCLVLGNLASIAGIFKEGNRHDLLPHASSVLSSILSGTFARHINTAVKKLSIKAIQRIGLTFLKPRLASWRYKRGCRSLAANLIELSSAIQSSQMPDEVMDDDEDDELDVPDEIAEIIEVVLQALSDKDTVVRWSAAKAVGRITSRLPEALADDVVDSLLDLFTRRDNTQSWHGGCLALGELGRRGLLTLSRLPDVMVVLLRALVYDEVQGSYSVGSSVRDAACYVCWAFARAYDANDFKTYAHQIAPALVSVALFDREVNCRRAASAAFQENVGRQGTYPHGIDILTTIDYFSVGNRGHSFTRLSSQVGKHPEYIRTLITHLLELKVGHWDGAMREVTSKALASLTPCDPEFVSGYVVDTLKPQCTCIDLNLRHGAILALAEVIYALSQHALKLGNDITLYIDTGTIEFISNLCSELSRRHKLRGMGGELMRHALCHLINQSSIAKLPLNQKKTIDDWQAFLDGCLEHTEDTVRDYALAALPHFTRTYRPSDDETDAGGDAPASLLDRYLSHVISSNQLNRRGYVLAVGCLPASAILGHLQSVLRHIFSCCRLTNDTKLWVECRRDGLRALTDVCLTVGVDIDDDGTRHVSAANVDEIYQCLTESLKDYTIDNRGDVGAWVREAAITGIQKITQMLANDSPTLLSQEIITSVFCGLAQQAVEKIDRTRALAGRAFSTLLYHDPSIEHIPERETLQRIFTQKVCRSLIWASETETFPLFSKLLEINVYRKYVLLGMMISAGGITERLVHTVGGSLRDYLRRLDASGLEDCCQLAINLLDEYQRQDRVTLPILRALEPLFTSELLNPILSCSNLGFDLVKSIRREITNCSDPHKLLAAIELLCALLQFTDVQVQKRCLVTLTILLCHRFPRIRKATANSLYEALLTYGEVANVTDEALDQVQTRLGETDWCEGVNVVKAVRNEICDLFGIPVPVPKVKK